MTLRDKARTLNASKHGRYPMASKKNQTTGKTDLRNSIRSQFLNDELELFDLLVAHYVRGEAQRKNIIGDYHRTGMDPERARAVAMAAIEYLADSPKRPNDGRYPRGLSLCVVPGFAVVSVSFNRVTAEGALMRVTEPPAEL